MTPAADQLFDTHAHLIANDWDAYPPSPLRHGERVTSLPRSVTADWLVAAMEAHGVERACVVQRGHVYGYDNRYIIDSGRRFRDRFVPVVILDAQDPDTPAVLTRMVREEGVRGIRFAQARLEDFSTGWMNSPEAIACWKAAADLDIPVSVIFFRLHLPWCLPALRFVAERLPSLRIVIDHVGTFHSFANAEVARFKELDIDPVLPGPPNYGIDGTIAVFERMPNVYFKLTEIVLDRLADQQAEPARFVRRLADWFGAERLMWGSDLGQSGKSYDVKARMARAAADDLDAGERRAFLHDTAARVYA